MPLYLRQVRRYYRPFGLFFRKMTCFPPLGKMAKWERYDRRAVLSSLRQGAATRMLRCQPIKKQPSPHMKLHRTITPCPRQNPDNRTGRLAASRRASGTRRVRHSPSRMTTPYPRPIARARIIAVLISCPAGVGATLCETLLRLAAAAAI